MDENYINDINKKFENLSKRCDKLENENIDYKKKLELNQTNILNLLKQQELLRNEYKKEINNIVEKFTKQIRDIYQMIPKNKNEIILDNENNDLFDIKKIKKDIYNMVEKRLEDFKYQIFSFIGKYLVEKKDQKKEQKNENIINFEDENIKNRFENKLSNIFIDKGQSIPDKDIKDLKKLGSAILIKYKQSPLIVSKSIIDRKLNNNKEIDEISRINNELKKGIILIAMDDIIYRKLDKSNPSKFLKDFREKYGIEDNEISDEEIKNNMIKYNNNEKKIIDALLKILKYIN